jgi:hypothetical protein
MPRRVIGLIALALLAGACAEAAGNVTVSEADRCARGGGLWRPALQMCERSAGGGGGY